MSHLKPRFLKFVDSSGFFSRGAWRGLGETGGEPISSIQAPRTHLELQYKDLRSWIHNRKNEYRLNEYRNQRITESELPARLRPFSQLYELKRNLFINEYGGSRGVGSDQARITESALKALVVAVPGGSPIFSSMKYLF